MANAKVSGRVPQMVQVFKPRPVRMQELDHHINNTPLSLKSPSTNKRKYLILEDFKITITNDSSHAFCRLVRHLTDKSSCLASVKTEP